MVWSLVWWAVAALAVRCRRGAIRGDRRRDRARVTEPHASGNGAAVGPQQITHGSIDTNASTQERQVDRLTPTASKSLESRKRRVVWSKNPSRVGSSPTGAWKANG